MVVARQDACASSRVFKAHSNCLLTDHHHLAALMSSATLSSTPRKASVSLASLLLAPARDIASRRGSLGAAAQAHVDTMSPVTQPADVPARAIVTPRGRVQAAHCTLRLAIQSLLQARAQLPGISLNVFAGCRAHAPQAQHVTTLPGDTGYDARLYMQR